MSELDRKKKSNDPYKLYQASVQTKSKPSEIEETPQKYGATDRIKHLFHSINLEDKEKIGELKEIEQEEIYINMLKEQREKMETLKVEFAKKNEYISELEAENANIKKKMESLLQERSIYGELKSKYDDMLHEVRDARSQKGNIEKEYERILEENAESKNLIEELKEENEKYFYMIKRKEDEVKIRNAEAVENQQNLHSQIQGLKNQEMKLKENNLALKNELSQMEGRIFELERVKDLNIALDLELKKANQIIFQEKNKNERFEREVRFDIDKMKKEVNDKNAKIFELNSLLEENRIEYENLKSTLKNFEESLSENKQKSQKDGKKIQKLKEDLAALGSEYQKSLNLRNELSEEHKRLFSKSKDNDRELQKLRKENTDLRLSLSKLIEKEEIDKRYRLELEKVKKEINSAKNEEVKKIHEAFTDIIQVSNQPSNYPSSTKSEKMKYKGQRYQEESLRYPETSNVRF